MTRLWRWLGIVAALLLIAGCATRRPPPPPPPPPPAPPPGPPPFTAPEVWTAEPGLVMRSDSANVTLPYVSMRLQVLRADSATLQVRCVVCRGRPTGTIDRAKVVYQIRSPREAAGMELADFVLAVRDAAVRKDFDALRQAMSRDFVYSLEFGGGPMEATAAWQSNRADDLQRLSILLDRGVANVAGTQVWAAPPPFAAQPSYQDLRAGFRRGRDGWEFIFLVRGGV